MSAFFKRQIEKSGDATLTNEQRVGHNHKLRNSVSLQLD